MAQAVVTVRASNQHKQFIELRKRIRSNGHRAVYNYARNVVKNARIMVPVRTGYLKSQIKWERIQPGVYDIYVNGDTQAQTGAYYGVYVEYGTRHMAAQPFFRPAIEASKAQFKADMKAIFR